MLQILQRRGPGQIPTERDALFETHGRAGVVADQACGVPGHVQGIGQLGCVPDLASERQLLVGEPSCFLWVARRRGHLGKPPQGGGRLPSVTRLAGDGRILGERLARQCVVTLQRRQLADM